MEFQEPAKVHRSKVIAVKDNTDFPKLAFSKLYSACCPEKLTLLRIFYPDAKPRAIAKAIPYFLPKVRDAENKIRKPLLLKYLNLVLKKRLSVYLQHSLGRFPAYSPHPRCQAAGNNSNFWFHLLSRTQLLFLSQLMVFLTASSIDKLGDQPRDFIPELSRWMNGLS